MLCFIEYVICFAFFKDWHVFFFFLLFYLFQFIYLFLLVILLLLCFYSCWCVSLSTEILNTSLILEENAHSVDNIHICITKTTYTITYSMLTHVWCKWTERFTIAFSISFYFTRKNILNVNTQYTSYIDQQCYAYYFFFFLLS